MHILIKPSLFVFVMNTFPLLSHIATGKWDDKTGIHIVMSLSFSP